MAHHYLAKFVIVTIVGLILMAKFAPEMYEDLKENAKEQFSGFTDEIGDRTKETVSDISNSSEFENINGTTYLNLGKIFEERNCVDSEDCNNNLDACDNKCFCSTEGECKKEI